MQQLNRIELIGTVGVVKTQKVNDTAYTSLSMVTNYCYKDRSGSAVIETQWHNVKVIDSERFPDMKKIAKGSHVHVIGRLRTLRYTDMDGEERTTFEVLANKIELLDPLAEGGIAFESDETPDKA